MTDQTDKRAERLKAALRENLRRRKAQVRGRSEMPDGRTRDETGPAPSDDAPPTPSEGDPA